MQERVLEHCWRWFGPHDPVTLTEISQTGATSVVTALHQVPVGETWTTQDILVRKKLIADAGLRWSVAESVSVHEDIKWRRPNCARLIDNYRRTLQNLAATGVQTVCYNFIPLLDWSRTDLNVIFADGSVTTRFESRALAAFDLFLLNRRGSDRDYSKGEIAHAERYFNSLDNAARIRLEKSVLLGFPGTGKGFTKESLRTTLESHPPVDAAEYRENLISFLREIIPVAEECGIMMAIHPDDPPWPLFGLPRAVSNAADLKFLFESVPSPNNGLTFCTGSLGASETNDVSALARTFASRASFLHLRNVKRLGPRDFVEDNHLEGDVDMYDVVRTFVKEQIRRSTENDIRTTMPMRPDHGHRMTADERGVRSYPGYSLLGRMRGLAELRGLELGILRSLSSPTSSAD